MFRKLIFAIALIPAVLISSNATLAAPSSIDGFIQLHQDRHSGSLTTNPGNGYYSAQTGIFKTVQLSGGIDIPVSDIISPAHFEQSNPNAARLGDGRLVVVWEDSRLGNPAIFAQIIGTDGTPDGSNFAVAGDIEGINLSDPRVVSDGSGGFYIAWREISTGLINAKRFGSNGTLLSGPFQINVSSGGDYAGPFDIASFPNGTLVAVWENYATENNIALRLFSTSGTALTDPIYINDNATSTDLWYPAVTINTTNSTIAVAWEDYRNGSADIYYQFVNADGSLFGSNISPISAAALDDEQMLPTLAFNSTDKFILGWLDTRDGNSRLYCQRFDLASGLIGTNTPVSTDSAEVYAYTAQAVAHDGAFALNWSAYSGSTMAVQAQLFSGGSASGDIIDIANAEIGFPPEIGTSFGNSGVLDTFWEELNFGLNDIVMQRYSTDGSPLLANPYIINDDNQGANTTEGTMAVVNDTLAVAVFSDQRNDIGDIYFEKVPLSGNVISENQKISADDAVSTLQSQPDISVRGTTWDAVWVDNRAFGGKTGPRILTNSADISDSDIHQPILISPEDDITPKLYPKIIRFDSGLRLAVWIEEAPAGNNFRGLFFTEDSLPSTPGDILTFDEASETVIEDISLSMDQNNNAMVSYFSRMHPDGPSARIIRLNSLGQELNEYGFTSDLSGIEINAIDAKANLNGVVSLLWLGTDANLYMTSLDINGAVLKSSVMVNDDPTADPSQIRVSPGPNGMIAAAWIDHRLGKPIMTYQVFDSEWNPVGVNFPASNADPRFMLDPSISAGNSKIWLAWSDPRSDGLGFFARAVDFTPTDIDNDGVTVLPENFALEQNYPNPFNPSTQITFSLPNKADIELSVYDILGRHVTTLARGEFPAGNHTVTWKAVDDKNHRIASGIYFYMLKTGERTETRKMILLK